MILMAKYLISILVLMFLSCKQPVEPSAGGLIEKTIQAHGWDGKKPSRLTFDFRKHKYLLLRSANGVVYERATLDPKDSLLDRWENFDQFSRLRLGVPEVVSDSMQQVYAQSINSVMYFTQLPLGLGDSAVIASYEGATEIKGQDYEVLKVTFEQEGGGVDFEDIFYYWLHARDFTVDYMAYSYHTNGGGTRFRVAKNAREIEGIRFQDYENYKPSQHPIALDSLPYLWEAGALEALSLIENKNIEISWE
jgi:hypothetical protein